MVAHVTRDLRSATVMLLMPADIALDFVIGNAIHGGDTAAGVTDAPGSHRLGRKR